MRHHTVNLPIVVASLVVFLLSACGETNQYVAPPPPKVTVVKPTQRSVTRYLEATGDTATVNSTDLVARISGFIQAISYQDGAQVKQGASLFLIEHERYQATVDRANAAA